MRGIILNNYDILQYYRTSDLRKLAKGKISEIVGINSEKILLNLSKILGNYESIRNNVEFRKPPAHTILEVIFESPEHMVKFEDLKPLVKKKIKKYKEEALKIDVDDSNKQYSLYSKILIAAWEYEGDLLPAESNILRLLRKELSISKNEHQLIMAHPEINKLVFNENTYRNEIEFLTKEGIVLIFTKDCEDYFTLSDETVDSLKELWEMELEYDQYSKLLESLKSIQLSKILKEYNLPCSGYKSEQMERIITNDIKPSKLLKNLSSDELSQILIGLNLSRYGKKEEKELNILDYFKNERYNEKKEVIDVITEIELDEKILSDEELYDLFSLLSTDLLRDILSNFKMRKSGNKNQLIERLIFSEYNIRRLLKVLKNDDIKNILLSMDLKSSGNKKELIDRIVEYYNQQKNKESNIPTQELFECYSELSKQDRRIYPKNNDVKINTCTMALDFERVTKYIFNNIFNINVKTQRIGKEEPDGLIKDEDGNIILYECKTVLNPPYSLPIAHRLQLSNYIDNVNRKYKDKLKGYIIISHSFCDNIEEKINEIKSIPIPISVVESKDLVNVASKWKNESPTETLNIFNIVKNGKLHPDDFEKSII